MTDQQTTTQPTQAAEPLSPDLQYLKDAGEDISEFLPKPPGEGRGEQTTDDGKTGETQQTDAKAKADADTQQQTDDAEPGEVRVGDDGRVRDAKGRFVPVKALHEERGRRQSLEKELADARDKLARAEERGKIATEGKGDAKDDPQTNPFQEADIDPATDVMGALQQERRRNAWLLAQQQASTKTTSEHLTQSDMMQAYRDDTARVVAARPDYGAAYKHVVLSRARELIAFGVTDKETITKQIREDEQEIIRQAVAGNRSPAETIYALAVAKGYQAPAAGQQQQQTATQKPAATTTNGKTPAQEIVESINKGQETGKTLTGAGGTAPAGLTLEQFLAMSADDILKLKATSQGMAQLRAIGAES